MRRVQNTTEFINDYILREAWREIFKIDNQIFKIKP